MKLGGSAGYQPPEPGNHNLRLISIIDVGTHPQPNSKYRPRRQIRLQWELPDLMEEITPDNGPSKMVPKTYSEIYGAILWTSKGLTPLGKAYQGMTAIDPTKSEDGVDMEGLKFACCKGFFAPTDKGVEVTQWTPVSSGSPSTHNEWFFFDWDAQTTKSGALQALSNLSEGMVKWITKANEFAALPDGDAGPGGQTDPFATGQFDDNDISF